MDRRAFIRWSATAVAASRFPRHASRDRLERIGIQLYTLRREMARDFEGTLARVAALGYAEVEFAGYFGHAAEAVRATLERTGLRAPATHLPFTMLREGWDRALDAAVRKGHRYVLVAWIPEEERRTLDGWKRVAELFNRAGHAARTAGLRFGFHNHDVELRPLEGRRPYDLLLAETDPADVVMEMDLYWTVMAAGDPLAYFAAHPGRFHLVHVKDSAGPPAHRMVDVGRGTIDFRSIFARRAQAGISHWFVEHDEPAEPFEFARASLEYLKRLEF